MIVLITGGIDRETIMLQIYAAQRLALPAGGRDEITPLYRNQLQPMQTA
jgi:hypothetical protein